MRTIILLCLLLTLATLVYGQAVGGKTVTFLWTATGDDARVGTASGYDIRYATDSLTLRNSWATATQVVGEPTPRVAGSTETYTTTLPLTEGVKYFFALKIVDEAGNWSGLSNIVPKQFNDTVPPDSVIDFR